MCGKRRLRTHLNSEAVPRIAMGKRTRAMQAEPTVRGERVAPAEWAVKETQAEGQEVGDLYGGETAMCNMSVLRAVLDPGLGPGPDPDPDRHRHAGSEISLVAF